LAARLARSFRGVGTSLLLAAVLLVVPGACAQTAQRPDNQDRVAGPVQPASQGTRPIGAAGADLQRVEDLVLAHTNKFRGEQGRGRVNENPELTRAAEYFAGYMARTKRYGHDADGQTPAERAQKHGYEYCLVSENIAYQYSSAGFGTERLAEGFVTGWKESPGHRKNMLDPDVTDTGVAVARSADGTYYAVQMFGRPRSMQVQFKVTNRAGVPVTYTLDGQSFPLPPRVTRTHTVCRPPKLEFPAGKRETLSPRSGSHYTLSQDANGDLLVQSQVGWGLTAP
jgi:uncharacterized protein YkwD